MRSTTSQQEKLTARFTRAVAYAARLHARQKRKGTERPYLAHLLGVASIVLEHGGSTEVHLVSAADKLHNAREILADYRQVGDAFWGRFQGGKEGALWYYRALVEALRSTGASPLVEELDRVVTELERLAR